MSIAKTYSVQLIGLNAELVTIEVDITNGLHSFTVIGLGDRSIEESRDRISAGIKNSGYVSPKQKNQKVVISLAPAEIKKEGSSFDLAMAIAYIKASGQKTFNTEDCVFVGELSLEGRVSKTNGVLAILCQIKKLGFKKAYIPIENSPEARLAEGLEIFAVRNLKETIDCLTGEIIIDPLITDSAFTTANNNDYTEIDISNIRGNSTAKRGLMIAAAGAHNVIMYGPPGTGKTMLARSFQSLLPPLSYEHAVEVTSIHSIANTLSGNFIYLPPFRSPHHTASYPSIVGGGSFPRPGEVTLAHRGVLFLDEFPEFDRKVIESLRQPLEEGIVTISRAKATVVFPSQCILLASMNPCPCGKGRNNGCECTEQNIKSYEKRISGPIADRIDIWLKVDKIDYDKLSQNVSSDEKSQSLRDKIIVARNIQRKRFSSNLSTKSFNAEMSVKDMDKYISLNESARKILVSYSEKMAISARSFHKILKVARTIADLEQSQDVLDKHILESLQYRKK